MATRKQRAAAMRRHRAYLRIERRYYQFIRRLYVEWWNENMPAVFALIRGAGLDVAGVKIDSLFGDITAALTAAASAFARKVQASAYVIRQFAREVEGETVYEEVPWLNAVGLEPSVRQHIEDFTDINTSLIVNVTRETANKVALLAQNAIDFGDTPDQLTAKIRAASEDFAGRRARVIARDQVGKLQGQIAETRMKEAGVSKYEWMDVGDNRVRPKHEALNGEIRTWDQSPKPGEEIQCRCQAIPILE